MLFAVLGVLMITPLCRFSGSGRGKSFRRRPCDIPPNLFPLCVPLQTGGEAEEYCTHVQQACLAYEDRILAPSVACGVVYKTNVEEQLKDKLPDAEYEMFNNKFEIKNAPGYRERLAHGVQ